jgi:hypothetical protein
VLFGAGGIRLVEGEGGTERALKLMESIGKAGTRPLLLSLFSSSTTS